MSEPDAVSDPLSEATRLRLQGVRRGLLHLHKALLDGERGVYEQSYGRVTSGQLLQLVIQHPWFAWLRSVSELVVQIDEMLEATEEPPTEEDANAVLRQIRSLLTPAEAGNDFGRRYYEALQRDPDVVLAHAEVSRLLPPAASDNA